MPGLLRFLLLPLSWIWALVLRIRHRMYDWGILVSEEAALPCIVVGNLSLGGTGKTPHTLWLAHRFSGNRRCAILSRGYGRKTRGFLEVVRGMNAADCGDEALEYLQELEGKVVVAVCEKRSLGIRRLKERHPELELVILDDALQHRALRGGYRILLSTCGKPWYRDLLLPAGTLRDLKGRAKQCHAFILTKCGENHKAELAIASQKFQKLVAASSFLYGEPVVAQGRMPLHFLAVAAIADPSGFIREVRQREAGAPVLIFRDHHEFTKTEIQDMAKSCREENRGIVTTRKDLMRLEPWLKSELAGIDVIYFPLTVTFLSGETELLNSIDNFLFNDFK